MPNHTWAKRVALKRIAGALREIGILVIAFTPLDAILLDRADLQEKTLVLGLFFAVGMTLFMISVSIEILAGIDMEDGER